MSGSPEEPPDPYTYNGGRWLRHDQLQHDSRKLGFDFYALCERAIELCPGAVSIARCLKTEGRHNRVIIFTFDNARRVVARLPTSVAGPARLTTNSEVATIKYIQSNTSVPTPKILDWSDDPSNPIGCEYIFTEHAAGVSLDLIWHTMSVEQKTACIYVIMSIVQQIAAIEFPAYGSLYFADAPLDSFSTLPMTQGYCIGPHCGTKYWNCNVGEARYYRSTDPNRGPWPHLQAYCNGLVYTGMSRLPTGGVEPSSVPSFHGSFVTHTRLLDAGLAVIREVSENPRVRGAAAATLCHADLDTRNIFVADHDPTIVTDLIDWQSSSIEPAFEYADGMPDFTAPVFHSTPLFNPSAHQTDEERAIQERQARAFQDRAMREAEICTRTFLISLQIMVPKLHAARALPDALFRPFRQSRRTWIDGAVAYRQDLIDIAIGWKELGLAGSCPYSVPTVTEMFVHRRELERVRLAKELEEGLIHGLGVRDDGWVVTEWWKYTQALHKQSFMEIVQHLGDPRQYENPMSEAEVRKIWPYDVDF